MVPELTPEAGIVLGAVTMLIAAPFAYLSYLNMKGRAHSIKGKGLALLVHTQVLGFAGCLAMTQFLLPAIVEHRPSWEGATAYMGLTFLASIGLPLLLTRRQMNPVLLRYVDIALSALGMGAVQQWLVAGFWTIGVPRAYGLETIVKIGSYLTLVFAELLFLSSNKWKILPRHPK